MKKEIYEWNPHTLTFHKHKKKPHNYKLFEIYDYKKIVIIIWRGYEND